MGKTRVWNRAGVEPPGFQGMGTPEQPAWTGSLELAPERRGLKILGTPLGSPEFVAAHMRRLQEQHSTLLEALRAMPEMQSAWLLLSLCANARANYYLRALPPSLSREFAESHDDFCRRSWGFWITLLSASRTCSGLGPWLNFLCAWAAWACVARSGWLLRPTGRLGRTAWRWFGPGTRDWGT